MNLACLLYSWNLMWWPQIIAQLIILYMDYNRVLEHLKNLHYLHEYTYTCEPRQDINQNKKCIVQCIKVTLLPKIYVMGMSAVCSHFYWFWSFISFNKLQEFLQYPVMLRHVSNTREYCHTCFFFYYVFSLFVIVLTIQNQIS